MSDLVYDWHMKHDYSEPTHKTLTGSFMLTDEDIHNVKDNGGKVYVQFEYWQIDTPLENLSPGINRIVLTCTLNKNRHHNE